ncbi:MAG: hypothetical protein ACRELV_06870 [Longimicrobiales bacterium]
MAGKLTARGQAKLSEMAELQRQLQHVHGLVEQFAAARAGQDRQAQAARRAFGRLKLKFMGAGLDPLSQLCGSMEIAAGRGMGQPTKSRILREGVASLRFQLELEERSVVAEETIQPKPDDD